MSNLTRPTMDVLLNTISKEDIGVYFEGTTKHLLLKKLGFDFVGPNTKAVVKTGGAGQKMLRTLTPSWTWNGEATQLFEIEVTSQPIYDSVPEHQFSRSVVYSFLMKGFVTSTPGTLEVDDADAIINGLVDAITADVQLNIEAVKTGAVVVATNVGQAMELQAKETGTIFTVRTYDQQFTQSVLPDVGYMKDKLTTDDVYRIFSVKEEHVGSFVNVPIRGVGYSCITLATRSQFPGIDLLGGVGQTVEQKLNIYLPTSLLTSALIVDMPLNSGANAAGVEGTTPDTTLANTLAAVCTGTF